MCFQTSSFIHSFAHSWNAEFPRWPGTDFGPVTMTQIPVFLWHNCNRKIQMRSKWMNNRKTQRNEHSAETRIGDLSRQRRLRKTFILFIYLSYMCVHVITCIQVSICTGARSQLLLWSLRCHEPCFLRQYLSMNLQLTHSARLTAQQAPETLLSPPPLFWDYKHISPGQFYPWVHGIKLRCLWLHDKHFTHGANSLAQGKSL